MEISRDEQGKVWLRQDEDSEPVAIDGPIEADCDCGHHLVVDPSSMESLLRQRRFRCYWCKTRKSVEKDLDAMTVSPSGKMAGICSECSSE